MSQHAYIILGPQGSGKGTQAQELANLLGVPHISTGEVFRNIVAKGSDFGREVESLLKSGSLVPDDVTNKLVAERLKETDATRGFILDGYPRNLNQAEYLATLEPEAQAIYLRISDMEAIKRLAGRRTCPACGAVYHLQFNPPKVGEVCDIDGLHLIQRTDETEQAIKVRLNIFHQQTEPLLEFYRQRGKLFEIDGTPPIAEVTRQLRELLKI
jgi:adenylate kinase